MPSKLICATCRRVTFRNGYEADFEFGLFRDDGERYGSGLSASMMDIAAMSNGVYSEDAIDLRYDTWPKRDGSGFETWVNEYILRRFRKVLVSLTIIELPWASDKISEAVA